jgi:RNA polymerase sigma-70 factor (ECF subfamily)
VIQAGGPARIDGQGVSTPDGVLDRAADSELMARLTGRDQRALVELYRRHARRLYPLIRRIVTNDALAEEILQDVFVRLWTRASMYRAEHGQLLPWLITMARNLALDALRRDGRWRSQLEFEEALHADPTGEGRGADVDTTLSVRHALSTLPDDQRRAVELAYFSGMTHAELAAHLNQPLGTVKSRLRLALDKLRDALGQVRQVRMAP